MATRLSTSFVLLLFLIPLLFVSSSAHKKPEPSPKSTPLSCDVRSVCLTAPYPDVCKQSTSLLSPFGARELPLVIRGMLGLCISSAKASSLQVKGSAVFGVGTSATGTCDKRMQAAVEVLEGAMKEVNGLRQPGSGEYAQGVAGIKGKVSKAVTSCDECVNVLRGVPSGFGPTKVTGSVEHTMMLSSNLLVFVEKLQAAVKKH